VDQDKPSDGQLGHDGGRKARGRYDRRAASRTGPGVKKIGEVPFYHKVNPAPVQLVR